MPLKRVPKEQRETPAMRRLRAEIIEELNASLTALGPRTPEQERRDAEYEARFWRRVEKRIEKGATEIDAILAEIEREDRKAAEKAGPPRDLSAAARPAAARPAPKAAPPVSPAPKAAPPVSPAAPAVAPAEKPKAKKRPAGFAGYVLIDGQES